MPIDKKYIGKNYGPTTYVVGAEKLREFAYAISGGVPSMGFTGTGAPKGLNPLLHDAAAAKAGPYGDLIGLPNFAVVFSIAPFGQAVTDPELVRRCADRWGSQAIVVAMDVRRTPSNWEVVTRGGRTRTGIFAREWAERVAQLGAGEILLTSMDRDGTLSGYDLELLRTIAESVSVPIIASGGAGTLEHLRDGILLGHASAVLAASIFHDGTYRIGEAKAFLAAAGIPMRPECALDAAGPARDGAVAS